MGFYLVPWWIALIWAVFLVIYIKVKYRKKEFLKNPFILIGIAVFGFFAAAWSAIAFLIMEAAIWRMNKKVKS
jgi:ABC-type Fe3+-siderophore transport system permease subunit